MILLDIQIKKFNSEQVVVHVIVALSIMILFITGLAQRYPEQLGWITDLIGLSTALFIHRFAAITLLASAVFYVINSMLGWAFFGSKYFNKYMKPIFPTLNDVSDVAKDVSFWGKQKTDYDKYSWIQKGFLWNDMVVNWGVMGISGIILWAPWLFTPFIPLTYLASIKFAHGGFAIVSLCVVLFHFYMVHLAPARFPMSFSMFTGTVSKEEIEKEYPRWHKEISGDKRD